MEEQTEVEPALRDLQEERFRLTSLKEHAGYQYLMAIAERQRETRHQAIFLKPLKSLDETLEQEYLKGELSGITLFMRMVDIRIDDLTNDITQRLKEEEEKVDGKRNDSNASTNADGPDDFDFADGAP